MCSTKLSRRSWSGAPTAALPAVTAWSSAAVATDIHVPADQPTIQQGIDAAMDGDRVLVAPGTYFETIDFEGRNIQVIGTGGAGVTVIDASNTGTAVQLIRGESSAVLQGFTVTHGAASNGGTGGAVQIAGRGAAPAIQDNVFVDNSAINGGAIGILGGGGGRIHHNQFRNNTCTELGGAVYVQAQDNVRTTIEDNVFERNRAPGGAAVATGGSAGPTLILRNVFRNNVALNYGAAISVNRGQVRIADNLIHDNRADHHGAAISLFLEHMADGVQMVNNTMANDVGREVSVARRYGGRLRLANNIIVTTQGHTSIHCETGKNGVSSFSDNLVYSPNAATISGDCDVAEGGVITSDPMFVGGGGPHAFWLSPGSPAIDAGNDEAAAHIHLDLTGARRIVGSAVDIGAYEYRGDRRQ